MKDIVNTRMSFTVNGSSNNPEATFEQIVETTRRWYSCSSIDIILTILYACNNCQTTFVAHYCES